MILFQITVRVLDLNAYLINNYDNIFLIYQFQHFSQFCLYFEKRSYVFNCKLILMLSITWTGILNQFKNKINISSTIIPTCSIYIVFICIYACLELLKLKNVVPSLIKMRYTIDAITPSYTFPTEHEFLFFVGKTKKLHLVIAFSISGPGVSKGC